MKERSLGRAALIAVVCLVGCGTESDGATPSPDPGPSPTSPGSPSSPPSPSTPDAAAPASAVDLRADTNRNGLIDLDDPTEDDGEETWDERHGAVFLANIDDDRGTCPKTGTDAVLAACNDAADTVINGDDDLLDLARLKVRPWAAAPEGASGTIALSEAAKMRVRLFKKVGVSFTELDPATAALSAAELRAGVELALEGRDIIRDAAVWDGTLDITLTVVADGSALGSDKVRMRMAPVVTPSHLDAPEQAYISQLGDAADARAFRDGMHAAVTAAGLGPVKELASDDDPWAQDYFETAYMSMPAQRGVHAMRVNYRSANYADRDGDGSPELRPAGRAVFDLRGKDVGAIVAYDPAHADGMDTLNSFGNFETVPPYTHNGKRYSLGRVLRGKTASYYPDAVFIKLIESQAVQPPLYVDTSWLLVGHIDEVVSFVPAATPRGWALLVADPRGARVLLQKAKDAGNGDAAIFAGLITYEPDTDRQISAATTVTRMLADPDVLGVSDRAAAKIDGILATLKTELGLADDEIVRVPFLFHDEFESAIAYQPGMVNGISLGKVFGAPKPHGPVIGGADLFEKEVTDRLTARGIAVHFIEDWVTFHLGGGEVHCGSNTHRAIPKSEGFWRSGR